MGYFDGRLDNLSLDQFDPNAFADELIAGADVSDTEREALRAVLGKTAPKLRNAVALRRDAQSVMDRARNVVTEAERIRDENFRWAEDNKAALAQLMDPAHRRTAITGPTGDVLSKADVERMFGDLRSNFDQRLEEQGQAFVSVLRDSHVLSNRFHELLPGERFDYGELQEFAITNKLPLSLAFDKYVQPKLEAKQKADMDKAVQDAYERGVAEALSRREADPSYADPADGDLGSVFKDRLLGRRTTTLKDDAGKELTGEDAFVRNWNATHGFTKPATANNH